jgi:hypothetical protein
VQQPTDFSIQNLLYGIVGKLLGCSTLGNLAKKKQADSRLPVFLLGTN